MTARAFGLRPLSSFSVRRAWSGLAALAAPGLALANPLGGQVVAGSAGISTPTAGTLVVDQTTSSAIINWQQFSIGGNEFVIFNQPSASAAVLNRVVGGMPSEILGNLTANGRVFILNPQGVMFGSGSRVDVGGLVASTMSIADSDFMSGKYVLGQAGPGSVVNHGTLQAREGGFVVLSGETVENAGLISARMGDVVLASGKAMTLDLDPAGLVSFTVDEAAVSTAAGVENLGQIVADGGMVVLTAKVARDLIGSAVNNQGRVSARSIREHDGAIWLTAEGGDIVVGGTLDASAATPDTDGGRIVVHADQDVTLTPSAHVLADGRGQGDGGIVRVIAEEAALVAPGSVISARGGSKGQGGFVELSGHGSLRVRGDVNLGRGGQLLIDPNRLFVAAGNGTASSFSGSATVYEDFVEGQLQSGVDVALVATDQIVLDDMNGGALDGRNGGAGGALLIGIGSVSPASSGTGAIGDPLGFNRGSGGAPGPFGGIRMNVSQAIRVDGRLTVRAGSQRGYITLGDLEGSAVEVNGADLIEVASVTATAGSIDVRNTANAGDADPSDDIYVNGALSAAGDITFVARNTLDFNSNTIDGANISLTAGADGNGSMFVDFVDATGSITVAATDIGGNTSAMSFNAVTGITIQGDVNDLGSFSATVSGAGDIDYTGFDITARGNLTLSAADGNVTGGTLVSDNNISVTAFNATQAAGQAGSITVGGVFSSQTSSAASGHITMLADENITAFSVGTGFVPGTVQLTTATGDIDVQDVNGAQVLISAGRDLTISTADSSFGTLQLAAGRDLFTTSTDGGLSGEGMIITAGRNIEFETDDFNTRGGGFVDITAGGGINFRNAADVFNDSSVSTLSVRSTGVDGYITFVSLDVDRDVSLQADDGRIVGGDVLAGGAISISAERVSGTVGQAGLISIGNAVASSSSGLARNVILFARDDLAVGAVFAQASGFAVLGAANGSITAGDINGGSIDLDAGANITLSGNAVATSGSFTATAGGDITGTNGSSSASLVGAARLLFTAGGTVDLGAANLIGGAGGVNLDAGDAVILRQAANVTGDLDIRVHAANAAINLQGNVGASGRIVLIADDGRILAQDLTAGGKIFMTAERVLGSAALSGFITAGNLAAGTNAAAPERYIDIGARDDLTVGDLSAVGSLDAVAHNDLLQVGNVTSGNIDLTGGRIRLNGDVAASTGGISLNAGGNVTGPGTGLVDAATNISFAAGGTVDLGTLQALNVGGTVGSLILRQDTSIGNLVSVTATAVDGRIQFTNLSAGGLVQLSANDGRIVGGDLTAGGVVDLDAQRVSGAVATAGFINVGQVTSGTDALSSTDSIDLTATDAVTAAGLDANNGGDVFVSAATGSATLGDISGRGISLSAGTNVTLTGNATASSGSFFITAVSGDIVATNSSAGAQIASAFQLDLSAGDGIDLATRQLSGAFVELTAGNSIQLRDVNVAGGLGLTVFNAGGLIDFGQLTVSGDATLNASDGRITGGSLSAGSDVTLVARRVAGTSTNAGFVDLTGDIQSGANLAASFSRLSVAADGDVNAGTVSAGNGASIDVDAGGAVTLDGVTAGGFVSIATQSGVTVNGNVGGVSGTFSASAVTGAISLQDVDADRISISASASSVSVGALTAGGGGSFFTPDVYVLGQGGVTAGSISLASDGVARVESNPGITINGPADVGAGGVLFLRDSTGDITLLGNVTGALDAIAGGDVTLQDVTGTGPILVTAFGSIFADGRSLTGGDSIQLAAGADFASGGPAGDLHLANAVIAAGTDSPLDGIGLSAGGGTIDLTNASLSAQGGLTLVVDNVLFTGVSLDLGGALDLTDTLGDFDLTGSTISAGSVRLTAGGGDLIVGDVDATAGAIELVAAGSVTAGNLTATDNDPGLADAHVSVQGTSISVLDVTTNATFTSGGSSFAQASISLLATDGNLSTGNLLATATNNGAAGGAHALVGVDARDGTVTTGSITTSATAAAGSESATVSVRTQDNFASSAALAYQGALDIFTGAIDADGDVVLFAFRFFSPNDAGDITTGAITARNASVNVVTGVNGDIDLGFLSGGPNPGDALRTVSLGAGGTLSFANTGTGAAGLVATESVTLTASAGGITAGDVTVTAGHIDIGALAGAVTAGDLSATHAPANGGADAHISVTGTSVDVGNVTTAATLTAGASFERAGADITLLATGGNLTAGALDATATSLLSSGGSASAVIDVKARDGTLTVTSITTSAVDAPFNGFRAENGSVIVRTEDNFASSAALAYQGAQDIAVGTIDADGDIAMTAGRFFSANDAGDITTGNLTARNANLFVATARNGNIGLGLLSGGPGATDQLRSVVLSADGTLTFGNTGAGAAGLTADTLSLTAGTGDLVAGDLTATGGYIDLFAAGALTALNVSATHAPATGNANAHISVSGRSVSLSNVTSLASFAAGSSFAGASAQITLTATDGNLSAGTISATANNGSATQGFANADVLLTARDGTLDATGITTSTSATVGAQQGNVTVRTEDNFASSAALAFQGAQDVTLGTIDAEGDINLSASRIYSGNDAGDITTGDLTAHNRSVFVSTNANGNIDLGLLSGGGSPGDQLRNITLNAGGALAFGNTGTGAAGLTGTGIVLAAGAGNLVAGDVTATAGFIDIVAAGAVTALDLSATHAPANGNADARVSVNAASITLSNVSSLATFAAGSTFAGATADITLIANDGTLSAGDISATANNTSATAGFARANVTLTAHDGALDAGNIATATSGTAGQQLGNVAVRTDDNFASSAALAFQGAQDITLGTIDADGDINLTAVRFYSGNDAGDITTGDLTARNHGVFVSTNANGNIDLGLLSGGPGAGDQLQVVTLQSAGTLAFGNTGTGTAGLTATDVFISAGTGNLVAGDITATDGNIDVFAAGTVTALSLSATHAPALGNADARITVAGTSVTLSDVTSLASFAAGSTFAGATATISLQATDGNLSAGAISATANNTSVSGGFAIADVFLLARDGTIDAGDVTTAASGTAGTIRGNVLVRTEDNFASSAALAFQGLQDIALGSVTAAGAIDISAARLYSANAAGDIATGVLTGTGRIDVVTQGGQITLGGADAGIVNVSAGPGRDILTSGLIIGDTVTLTATNLVGAVSTLVTTRVDDLTINANILAPLVTLTSAGDLAVTGIIDAGAAGTVTLTANNGQVTAGAITTSDLSVTANFLALGDLSITGDLALASNLGDIDVGAITAQGVTLDSAANVSTGAITAGGVVQVDAVGAIDLGGAVTGTSVTMAGASIATPGLLDITATTGAISLTGATVSGDGADLVAPGGITVNGTLDAGAGHAELLSSSGTIALGDLVAGSLAATALSIDAANLSPGGVLSLGGDITLTALSGNIDFGSLQSTGGAVTLDGAALAGGGIQAAGDITLQGTSIDVGALQTDAVLVANATAGDLTIGGASRAASADLDASGTLQAGTLETTAGLANLDAATIIVAGIQSAGGIELDAGTVDAGALDAAGALLVTATSGDIVLGGAATGATVTLDATGQIRGTGPLAVTSTVGALVLDGTLITGSSVDLDAASLLDVTGTIRATGGNVQLSAGSSIGVDAVQSLAGGAIGIDAGTGVSTGALTATGGGNITVTTLAANIVAGNVNAGFATFTATGGGVDLGNLAATGASLTAGDGALALGNVQIGTGGFAYTFNNGSGRGSFSAGNVTIDGVFDGDFDNADITLGAITADAVAFTGSDVTLDLGAITADEVSIVLDTLGGDVSTGAITTTGANGITLQTAQGDVVAGNLLAGTGAISVATGNGLVQVQQVTGGTVALDATGGTLSFGPLSATNADLHSTSGNLVLTGITVTGALSAEAEGGNVQAGNLALTGALVLRSGIGSVTGGTLTAQSIDLDAATLLQAGNLTATAGPITLDAGTIDVGALAAGSQAITATATTGAFSAGAITGGAVQIASLLGDIQAGDVTATTASFSAPQGALSLGVVSTTGDAEFEGGTSIDADALDLDGAFVASFSGLDVSFGSITAQAIDLSVDGGSLAVGDLAASGAVSLSATGGGLTFGDISGSSITLHFEADSTFTGTTLTTAGTLRFEGAGTLGASAFDITAGSLQVAGVGLDGNLDAQVSGAATIANASLSGNTGAITASTLSVQDSTLIYTSSLSLTTTGGAMTIQDSQIGGLLGKVASGGDVSLRSASNLSLAGGSLDGDVVLLEAGTGGSGNLLLDGIDISGGVTTLRAAGSVTGQGGALDADALGVIAGTSIDLSGTAVHVHSGQAPLGGDALLQQLLAELAQEEGTDLRPASATPNASFIASTVTLGAMQVDGGHVFFNADQVVLGGALQGATGMFVQYLPRTPDATLQLESAQNDGTGVQLSDENHVAPLGDGATVVFGGSGYGGDILVGQNGPLDLDPRNANLLFFTTGSVNTIAQVASNGQVIVLEGISILPPPVEDFEEPLIEQFVPAELMGDSLASKGPMEDEDGAGGPVDAQIIYEQGTLQDDTLQCI